LSELQLDWTHRGQRFQVEVGDLIRVALWSNATTGFYWSPVLNNDDVLEEADDAELKHEVVSVELETPTVLGSGALRQMGFWGRRPGIQDLVLRCWRGIPSAADIEWRATIEVRG